MKEDLDTDQLRRLEMELGTAIYPGTEIMTDVGSYRFVKAINGDHTVLVPQPSNDERDPLNWSSTRKGLTIFCITLMTFAQGFGPLSLAPMLRDYAKAFDSTLADVVQFTGTTILTLGFSNFIWTPIQTCFGRRPVIIFSTLICFGASIWCAEAKSYGSYMGACVLTGIGGGPGQALQPTVIADVIFLHDRGKYNGLFFASDFGSHMVGGIVAGHMAEKYGWRSFWWLNAAILAFSVICSIFLFPETRFNRVIDPNQRMIAASQSSTTGSREEVKDITSAAGPANPEIMAPMPSQDKFESVDRGHIHTHEDLWLGRGSPSKAQWKLAQPYEGDILKIILTPWKLFAFPIVLFASFVVSWSASATLTVNVTQSLAFGGPPYNFSSGKIGLFNLALLVGAIIGLFTAGPLSDYIAARLTKRQRGIREPEMRLWTIIPYAVIMIIGQLVLAFGYEYKWDWKVIVMIGWTCSGIQVAALPAIASTYAVDSYKSVTGSLFIAITINKNLWSYGFTKFITPWIERSGYIPPIMMNMGLTTFWCSAGILFWFYGKTFRKWTSNSKVHNM